jgi:hypothetical protein
MVFVYKFTFNVVLVDCSGPTCIINLTDVVLTCAVLWLCWCYVV